MKKLALSLCILFIGCLFMCCQSDEATITHSGFNSSIAYVPHEYCLCEGDSLLAPVYNGLAGVPVPLGSKFDTPPPGQSSLLSKGVSINTATGVINLYKTLRNGALGKEGDVKYFRLYYRLNDHSNLKLKYTNIITRYYTEEITQEHSSVRIHNDPPRRCTTVVINSK
jgi:hypothetical protein